MINNWKRVLIDGAPEVFDKGQRRHKQDDAFHGIRLVETPVSVKILAADHLQRVQRASAARPPPSEKKSRPVRPLGGSWLTTMKFLRLPFRTRTRRLNVSKTFIAGPNGYRINSRDIPSYLKKAAFLVIVYGQPTMFFWCHSDILWKE